MFCRGFKILQIGCTTPNSPYDPYFVSKIDLTEKSSKDRCNVHTDCRRNVIPHELRIGDLAYCGPNSLLGSYAKFTSDIPVTCLILEMSRR